ncbi:MAG: DUF1289 domain-containing protein [Gammaproteobacteria bacterium]|nr:DUF1289 domain-containing protein [Gammaproteobacteria bacterium]
MWQTAQSPCIGVCQLAEKTNLCTGCLRSLDEIRRWPKADEQEKAAILKHVRQRRKNQTA